MSQLLPLLLLLLLLLSLLLLLLLLTTSPACLIVESSFGPCATTSLDPADAPPLPLTNEGSAGQASGEACSEAWTAHGGRRRCD
ncbi:hypothetical protein BS50DRAFT_579530 [Corynespora cassiicola Philippines]|uniref:Secreted protein n=1 Tax=Corynespora cassiicola Philippines TaxID=1448308 RepID=A0A2T2N3K4_CORCC|nr:hypothetical protein BS50DRAFT_579530 [Corynespora cassiicola Philippines]